MPEEIINCGIESTLELINIVKPERLILLSKGGFKHFTNKKIKEDLRNNIRHIHVFESPSLEIGQINGINTVGIHHPSQKWPIGSFFPSVYLLIHKLSFKDGNGKIRNSLEEIRDIMRREFNTIIQNVKL